MWKAFINVQDKNFIFQWYFVGLGIKSAFSLHELTTNAAASQCLGSVVLRKYSGYTILITSFMTPAITIRANL